MTDIAAASQPWYRTLDRAQWKTLIAANLGWVFDGYETYALIISVGVALRQLLDPASYPQIPVYAGTVIALTLLGWGIGGLIGGVIADYIGRKRAMMLAILAYSIMTGLSAFAWDWFSFAVLRFLVGLEIGSEWVTGTSIVSEFWPDKNRGKGVGLMQCGFGVGFFLASLAWLFISPLGPSAWRVMFLLGVVPALLTLWIRRAIPESEKWERVNEQRAAAPERKRSGAQRPGGVACAFHDARSVRRAGDPQARDPHLPDVARLHVRILGNLRLDAALHGERRRQSRPAGAAMGELRRDGRQRRRDHRLCGVRFPCRCLWPQARHHGLCRARVPFRTGLLHLDPRLDAAAGGGSVQRHFRIRPVHLDGGMAAGTLPDARARDRGGVRVQHAASDCMDRPVDLGLADREFRRLQPGRGGDRAGLYPEPRGGAVPAGDARQAAAGVVVFSSWANCGAVRLASSGGHRERAAATTLSVLAAPTSMSHPELWPIARIDPTAGSTIPEIMAETARQRGSPRWPVA